MTCMHSPSIARCGTSAATPHLSAVLTRQRGDLYRNMNEKSFASVYTLLHTVHHIVSGTEMCWKELWLPFFSVLLL